ncbi:hypothetical protein BMS3Bbin14_00409 [bacterium BMS3Bbin14]|nr:hypothetical protein BMS3Abin13_00009 [bacterium BMS3Abin13]GBE51951.1 hypothetical protein BMS3Bbin14_00409 [bacterium BMS3Bbin14]
MVIGSAYSEPESRVGSLHFLINIEAVLNNFHKHCHPELVSGWQNRIQQYLLKTNQNITSRS